MHANLRTISVYLKQCFSTFFILRYTKKLKKIRGTLTEKNKFTLKLYSANSNAMHRWAQLIKQLVSLTAILIVKTLASLTLIHYFALFSSPLINYKIVILR